MRLANDFSMAIIVVLHQNKADNNPRGHLGAELTHKSELVVEIKKEDNVITIKQALSRDLEFECFGMKINTDGVTESCELKIKVDKRKFSTG